MDESLAAQRPRHAHDLLQTPPQLAAKWGIDCHKILQWIRSGELRAVNLATTVGGRPRYRIDSTDAEVFLARRAAGPTPKAPRRRRQPEGVTQYF